MHEVECVIKYSVPIVEHTTGLWIRYYSQKHID